MRLSAVKLQPCSQASSKLFMSKKVKTTPHSTLRFLGKAKRMRSREKTKRRKARDSDTKTKISLQFAFWLLIVCKLFVF